jgi:hypothetical protein
MSRVHVAVTARKWDLSPVRPVVATLRRRVRDFHHNIKSRAFSFCHSPTPLIHKVSIFNKMSVPITASTTTSSIPYPITALAPELREMISEYYFEDMEPPRRSAWDIYIGTSERSSHTSACYISALLYGPRSPTRPTKQPSPRHGSGSRLRAK